MPELSRRAFFGAVAGAAALAAPRTARAADSHIEILLNEPLGTVAPELYGHFTEHIGAVVYDGIWVGENSKIPNTGGIRQALVDGLKKIQAPVIRWPGGCFADSYDWRDGIGPRDKRPRRTNFWVDAMRSAPDGPQKYDPNQFGTTEFVRFCRLAGAQPYFAANVRSLTPLDLDHWMEYCNAPAGMTTYSDMRAAAGDRDPYNIRYWGVGNESWGCGGDMTPEEYATEFRKFTSWIPGYGVDLRYIASGPNGGDLNWTHGFFRKLIENGKGQLHKVYGWAMHYYCGSAGKGALDFDTNAWYELLAKADAMEGLISRTWNAMGEIDNEHRVKLFVDEWGAWHPSGTEIDPTHLFGQASSLRDALVAALTLDTFNRHADKLAMCNVAQLVNNLHSLFIAHEDRFVTTANYHVFEMYAAHHGGRSLRTLFSAPRAARNLWGLAGSASLKGKTLTVTVVNPHATELREASLAIRGASIENSSATVLTAPDMHAHNTFSNPRAVETSPGGSLAGDVFRFQPKSVTRLTISLA